MLVALLSVGVLLAAPVFYLFAEWTRLSRAERSQVRELVEQARALPNDPARFTREQALAAQRIISRAHELPSLLPSDIRELRPLWEARRDIRERAQQHRDSAVPGEQGIDAVARVWARAFYSHIERGESQEASPSALYGRSPGSWQQGDRPMLRSAKSRGSAEWREVRHCARPAPARSAKAGVAVT